MANKKLPYSVDNKLDSFIIKEVGKRMANTGIKVNKKDIMLEIAEHCCVGYENINRIKRKLSLPSLVVALKIADYFNTSVESIFHLD